MILSKPAFLGGLGIRVLGAFSREWRLTFGMPKRDQILVLGIPAAEKILLLKRPKRLIDLPLFLNP